MPDGAVIAVLANMALGWGIPHWAARLFGWAIPILAAIALAGGVVAVIYHKGESAGGAKVEATQAKAHAETIAQARTDERKAQMTVDAIGKHVAAADDETTALVRSKITEIHDVLDATPGAMVDAARGGTGPAIAFDTGGLRASLNTLVDGANRAAEAADAER